MAERRLKILQNQLATSSPNPSLSPLCPASCKNVLTASYPQGILAGQVAIITGSAQGIGAEIARLFVAEGAKVVLTDLDEKKMKAVGQEIEANGGSVFVYPGDICDPTFPDRLVQETLKKFGKINILVNNAGYTWDGVIYKMTDKQWNAMLEVHNTAPFRLIRACAPHMRDTAKKEKDEGKPFESRSIVNISSVSGLYGNFGQANYATAKMGIIGLTKTVSKEFGAFGIRCNAIAFGTIKTRLTQNKEEGAFIEVDGQKVALGIPAARQSEEYSYIALKRPGTVRDAALSVLYFASPLSSFVTGQVLEVSGGQA